MVESGHGDIGALHDRLFRGAAVVYVHHFFEEQVLVVLEVDHKKVIVHRVDEERNALAVQEIAYESDKIGRYFLRADIFHRVQVVEDRAVHRDDRKLQIDLRQDLADGRGSLHGGDREAHALVKEAVHLYLGIAGELPVFAEEDMVDAGHEQGLPVRDARQVHGVDEDRYADAYDRFKSPVENMNIRIFISDMVHRYAQEYDCGEKCIFLDVQQYRGVDHEP